MRFRSSLLSICVLLLFLATAVEAFAQGNGQSQTKSPIETALSTLEWRSIGPANYGRACL
jgi:hypothetical protein